MMKFEKGDKIERCARPATPATPWDLITVEWVRYSDPDENVVVVAGVSEDGQTFHAEIAEQDWRIAVPTGTRQYLVTTVERPPTDRERYINRDQLGYGVYEALFICGSGIDGALSAQRPGGCPRDVITKIEPV